MLYKEIKYNLTLNEEQVQVLIESLYVYNQFGNITESEKHFLEIAEELRHNLIKGK